MRELASRAPREAAPVELRMKSRLVHIIGRECNLFRSPGKAKEINPAPKGVKIVRNCREN
jgi:hypothetical protein